MKALILVGGFGTRLRPLTLSVPKPIVPFSGKKMIVHQMEALVKVGVKEVILAVNYQPHLMAQAMHSIEEELGIKISYSQESEPLGTAGPIALAADLLRDGDDPFFVLNSDVISEFPFEDLLKFHKSHGAEGTIMVTRVEEPSKYGVVVHGAEGKIDRFVEKPQVFVGNKINAGLYLFNPSILDRIEVKPTSIETEIFPKMADDGQLYAMELLGFWMDVGQPKDYLTGLKLYLGYQQQHNKALLSEGASFVGPVMVHPTARIGKGCVIGPFVTIGANVVIEDGVRLSHTAVFDGCHIRSSAWIHHSIIGWSSTIGRWVRIENVSVLGEDVHVKDEIYVNGARILPHKTIKASVATPQVIL